MNQTELAKKFGISGTYLSMILKGQRKAPERFRSQLPDKLYSNNIKNIEESEEFRSDDPIVDLVVNEEHGIFHRMIEDWKQGGYKEDILSFINSDRFALFLAVVNPKIDVGDMREKLKEKLFSMKKKA